MKTSDELDPSTGFPNLDFSKGVRGKYFGKGTNLRILDPDLLDAFPDSEAVNTALRSLEKTAIPTGKKPKVAKRGNTSPA